MKALDFGRRLTALNMSFTTHLLWKTLDSVPTDIGVSIVPTTTFADCPEQLDIILVPGGFGSNAAMHEKESLALPKSRGASARHVTPLCSGSILLSAAGLLDDYKETSHWASYPALKAMNSATTQDRVLTDRNRITGGGVAAGIELLGQRTATA